MRIMKKVLTVYGYVSLKICHSHKGDMASMGRRRKKRSGAFDACC